MVEKKTAVKKTTAPKKATPKKSVLEQLDELIAQLRNDGWTVEGRLERLNEGVSEGKNL